MNGDKLFWEEKFHAANRKAQACTQGAFLFLFSSLAGKEGRGSFLPSSQYVLTMFPLSSQWFAISFPICSPTCSPQHLTFNPYALANVVLLSPKQVGQREGTLQFKINLSFWGRSFFLSDGRIKLACSQNEIN